MLKKLSVFFTIIKLMAWFMVFIVPALNAQTLHPCGLVPEPGGNTTIPMAYKMDGTITLPASIDLTSKFPSPGNQGSLGSCVAFATGYAYKSYQERDERGWAFDTDTHIFSPAYIYNQIHLTNEDHGGGAFFSTAFTLLQTQGCATLNIMPYDGSPYACTNQPTTVMMKSAAQYKSRNWARLPDGDYNEIKTHLANNEPVVIGIPVLPDFDNININNQIFNDTSGTSRGAHALCVIGYDDDRSAVKIINSWGTGWGLGGYGWISYDLISSLKLEAYVMTDLLERPIYFNEYSATLINMGTSIPPAMTGDFTIEMWVYPMDTQETYANIIDFNHRNNIGLVFQQNGNNLNDFIFGLGNGSTTSYIQYQLQTKTWQHIAFQREGTTIRLFVNGNLVASQACFAGDVYYLPDSSATLWYNLNYGRQFNGMLKGVKLWDYARCPASILSQSMKWTSFTFMYPSDGIRLGQTLAPELVKDFCIDMYVQPGSSQQTYANILDFNHRNNIGMVFQQNGDNINEFCFSMGNGSTSSGILFQLKADKPDLFCRRCILPSQFRYHPGL